MGYTEKNFLFGKCKQNENGLKKMELSPYFKKSRENQYLKKKESKISSFKKTEKGSGVILPMGKVLSTPQHSQCGNLIVIVFFDN